jgi:hypothetical protein
MTRKQMDKFIRLRNNSSFNTNLQFAIDMGTAGIGPKELDNATNLNGRIGCWWDTPVGVLVELYGQLTLYPAGTIIDMTTGEPFNG